MKTTIGILLALALSVSAARASSISGSDRADTGSDILLSEKGEEAAISKCILGFANAADESDADRLSDYLDENYRVVMNRLFGSTEVAVVDRATYLSKIRTKEWGGDKRKVDIEAILVNGNNATAKVRLQGEKSTVISLLTLVQDATGVWRVVSDVPVFN